MAETVLDKTKIAKTSKASLAKETSKAFKAALQAGLVKKTYKTYNAQSLNFHKTVGKTFSYLSLF